MRRSIFLGGIFSLGLFSVPLFAASPAPRDFATPEQAIQAVIAGCRRNSTRTLLAIFGPAGKDIVESGDRREDAQARRDFARLALEKVEIKPDGADPNRMLVTIGSGQWPFPVPLLRTGDHWHFDSAAGRSEILARRIGANELNAIEICRGYVEAQKNFAEVHHSSGLPVYAQKIVSSEGQQDGLYWPPTAGASDCDIPPGLAQAAEGMAAAPQLPYHGYYFRILKSQGPKARGGAVSYLAKGSMLGGFALIARPAEYGISGVKTFIVNHDAVVYQKDLGEKTGKLAVAINDFDPDPSWEEVP